MYKMKKLIFFPIFLSFLTLSSLNAGVWKAGVASMVITPEQPMWLAGYAARTHPSDWDHA